MSMRHSVPLFALGLIRLCSVKGLAYVEHVTEYGMHWNFFFTLSLLPPIVEVFDDLVMVVLYEILSLGIAILYQVILESTNLKTFILLSLRGPDFLSKNREVIFSFFGYLAIFLGGRAIGTRITLCLISSASSQQIRKSVLLNLAGQAFAWTGLFILHYTWAATYGVSEVSRRLANLP
jgi:phosphatidylinositol glycan class W